MELCEPLAEFQKLHFSLRLPLGTQTSSTSPFLRLKSLHFSLRLPLETHKEQAGSEPRFRRDLARQVPQPYM